MMLYCVSIAQFLLLATYLIILPPVGAAVIRVNGASAGTVQDGSSWDRAYVKIGDALAASIAGDEIWVTSGTYAENITIPEGTAVYAGFQGTELNRDERDWRQNTTTLTPECPGYIVVLLGPSLSATIDGFTITGGRPRGLDTCSPYSGYHQGGGIKTTGGTVRNCILHNNQNGDALNVGGAITGHSTLIEYNVIRNNSTDSGVGGGIFCTGPAMIRSNWIEGNTAGGLNALIWPSGGGGIYSSGEALIANNVVIDNIAYGVQAKGGGIYASSPGAVVRGNTVVGNTATDPDQPLNAAGGGVYIQGGTLVNNIVAYNASGIANGKGGIPVLRHNDVFGNTNYDFSGLTDPTGINGNIKVNPLFTDAIRGNYHLKPGSPAADSGDDAFVDSGETDIEGLPRIQGQHVNMGAFERLEVVPPRLVFTTPPTGARAGKTFNIQPRVTAQDENGATLSTFNGSVTVSIQPGTGPSGAQLIGTTSRSAVSGVAAFSGLLFDRVGNNYTLVATSPGFTPGSVQLDVLPLATEVPIVRAALPVKPDGIVGYAEWHGAPELLLGLPEHDIKPGQWNGPSDYSARIRLKWDENNLYLLVDVMDDLVSFPTTAVTELYLRDALELFLGLKNPQVTSRNTYDRPGDYQVVISADEGTLTPRWYSYQAPETIHGSPGTVSVTRPEAHGYRIEGALPWSLLAGSTAPVLGQVLGFNLQGSDNDQAQPASGSALTLSGLNASFADPGRWTTARLIGVPEPPDVRLVFTQQPSGGPVGVPFDFQPILELRDSANNLLTSFNEPVSLSIKPGTGSEGASLLGTTTLVPVNGRVQFSGLSIDRPGSGFILQAVGGLASSDSNPFTVTGGPPRLVFSTQPGLASMGVPFARQPAVTVQDGAGNVLTSYSGQVSLSLKAGSGTPGSVLSGTRTVAVINGAARFTDLSLDRTGVDYVLMASSASLASAESQPFCVALTGRLGIARAEAPVVPDGRLGYLEWFGADSVSLGLSAQDTKPGKWNGAADYSARARWKWDADNLYFAIEVTDDVVSFPDTPETGLYTRDALELYIGLADPQNPDRRSYDTPGDYQIILSADEDDAGNLTAHWYSFQAPETLRGNPSTVENIHTPDGYILEGSLPWSLLPGVLPPVAGQVIGFNLQALDNDQTGPATDSAFSLSGLPSSFNNPSRWIQAQLRSDTPVLDVRLVFEGLPSIVEDQVPFSGTVKLVGPTGAVVDDFNGDIRVYQSNDDPTHGTTVRTAKADHGIASFTDLTISLPCFIENSPSVASLTATSTVAGGLEASGNSPVLSVTNDSWFCTITRDFASDIDVGTTFRATVAIERRDGSPACYQGQLTLKAFPEGGGTPVTWQQAVSNASQATFTVSLVGPGRYRLLSDWEPDAGTVSGWFNANPKLAFAVQPGPGAAGIPVSPQPVVEWRDGAGQPVSLPPHWYSYADINLSLKPGTGSLGAMLSLGLDPTISEGRALFSGVSVDRPGVGYVLVARCGASQPIESQAFQVALPIVKVRPSGDDLKSGATWSDAKATIQAAIDASAPGGEVWVAAGTYPHRIQLRDSVDLYGGFAGTEVYLEERVVKEYQTVIGGPDAEPGTLVNAFADVISGARLDGFTVTGAKYSQYDHNGGFWLESATVTIANSLITGNDNIGIERGAGGISAINSQLILENVIVSNNYGYQSSGGIALDNGAVALVNCRVTGNQSSQSDGGGMTATNAIVNILDSVFDDNDSELEGDGGGLSGTGTLSVSRTSFLANEGYRGGGIYWGGSVSIVDCDFVNNLSVSGGGAHLNGTNAVIRDCVFEGNQAQQGAALLVGSAEIDRVQFLRNKGSDLAGTLFCAVGTVRNSLFARNTGSSILWANGAQYIGNTLSDNTGTVNGVIYAAGSLSGFTNNIIAFNSQGINAPGLTSFRHNNVYGNIEYNVTGAADPAGTDGNISMDPSFRNRSADDYRLLPSSACIDTGNITFGDGLDLDRNPRTSGDRVDMGAFEYQAPARYGVADVVKALRIIGGLEVAHPTNLERLDVAGLQQEKALLDILDVALLARKAAGLDANP